MAEHIEEPTNSPGRSVNMENVATEMRKRHRLTSGGQSPTLAPVQPSIHVILML